MSKVIVTFEKNWRGYAAGETAGFDTATAESLIEAGYAAEAGKETKRTAKPTATSTSSGGKPAKAAAGSGAASQDAGQPGAGGKP